jgi:translation initiation factor 5B
VIKATSKGKKDKKKPKKGAIDTTNGVPDGSVVAEEVDGEGVSTPKGAVEVTAEDLADEEWGPVKEKKKKDKKGKGKKSKQQDDDEEEEEKDGRLFKPLHRNALICQLRGGKICACSCGTCCTAEGRQ